MEIQTKTRRWGNSIAVIIPSHLVEQAGISENQSIVFTIKSKKVIAKDFFGKFPRKSNKTAQEIKDEIKKGWGNGSLKQ